MTRMQMLARVGNPQWPGVYKRFLTRTAGNALGSRRIAASACAARADCCCAASPPHRRPPLPAQLRAHRPGADRRLGIAALICVPAPRVPRARPRAGGAAARAAGHDGPLRGDPPAGRHQVGGEGEAGVVRGVWNGRLDWCTAAAAAVPLVPACARFCSQAGWCACLGQRPFHRVPPPSAGR